MTTDSRLVIDDGDIFAIDNGHCVEIYVDAGELYYGSLPSGSGAEDVKIAVRFYRRGFEHGKQEGRIALQGELRRLLGVINPPSNS